MKIPRKIQLGAVLAALTIGSIFQQTSFCRDINDPAEFQRVLSEFKSSLDKTERKMKVMTAELTLVTESKLNTPTPASSTSHVLLERSGDDFKKYTVTVDGKESVTAVNDRSGFMIAKSNNSNQYALKETRKITKPSDQFRGLTIGFQFINAPFAPAVYRMIDLLNDPGTKIDGVQSIDRDGKPFYLIRFTLSPDSKYKHYLSGTVTVSPGEDWAIVEFLGNIGGNLKGQDNRVTVEYEKTNSNGFVPRKITDKRADSLKTIVTVDKLRFDPVPEDHFSLTYYGLPDLDAPPTPDRFPSIPSVFFGGAILTIILAIALKILVNRRAR